MRNLNCHLNFITLALLITVIVTLCGCSPNEKENDRGASDDDHKKNTIIGDSDFSEDENYDPVLPTEPENHDIKPSGHLKLTVTDSGYDIYTPSYANRTDYRFGPSIMLHDDGGMDVWLSAPGNGKKELDWILYKHSDDGGVTWTDEKAVLSPSPESMDNYSVCDPDVFYHNGYYYIGYTSTIDEKFQGFCNSVFIARSPYPDGPYEKWNGSGWGGSPEPLVYYDGQGLGWGRGEPSFVIVDETLYLYITLDAYSLDYNRFRATEVYTADISSDNWPNEIAFRGYATDRTDCTDEADGTGKEGYAYSDCDSWDVAYVEEYGKFIAVCTNRRFSTESCLLYYESDDGVYFERVSELNTNVICGSHNCGLMSDEKGHIKNGDPALIGYAYSGSGNSAWGAWVTRFAPVSITLTDEPDNSEDGLDNLKEKIDYGKANAENHPLMVGAEPLVNRMVCGSGTYSVNYYWVDSNRDRHYLNASDIRFSGYDRNVISIEGGMIRPVNPGITYVTIKYRGMSRDLCFCSLEKNVDGRGNITEFSSYKKEYTVSMSGPYCIAVRPIMRYENYSIRELLDDSINQYGVSFRSENEALCIVRDDGVIVPLSTGDTRVAVSCSEGLSFEVDVHITE
ncbi:MAG: hypothetical protein K5770_12335 [Lachnospiraceae bacterium]|nr:hypothetical protein [Lachnospiraceae bacterium]